MEASFSREEFNALHSQIPAPPAVARPGASSSQSTPLEKKVASSTKPHENSSSKVPSGKGFPPGGYKQQRVYAPEKNSNMISSVDLRSHQTAQLSAEFEPTNGGVPSTEFRNGFYLHESGPTNRSLVVEFVEAPVAVPVGSAFATLAQRFSGR